MQDRYTGDIGDYGKLGMLRYLAAAGLRVGVNWYRTPDEDHGGNLLTTLQDMILQSYGESIYVLPAFPKDWNVRFKLYTLGNNTVTGVYENGKWVEKPTLGHKSKQKIRLNR